MLCNVTNNNIDTSRPTMTGRVSKQNDGRQLQQVRQQLDASMETDDRCYRQRFHLTVLTSSPHGLARTSLPEVNYFRYVEVLF